MFDLDYPGQYMRRIKSVALTIPCVTGPYTGVHCRLTLLEQHDARRPAAATARAHAAAHRAMLLRLRRADRRGREYALVPGRPTHRSAQYGAREAIATSSGQNDSGLFELSFRDERYLPFEYHGAVSRWRIELPPENNYFDLDTLTDVVLHLNYTAREGGGGAPRGRDASARRPAPRRRAAPVRRPPRLPRRLARAARAGHGEPASASADRGSGCGWASPGDVPVRARTAGAVRSTGCC